MKRSELRQIIREEMQKSIHEVNSKDPANDLHYGLRYLAGRDEADIKNALDSLGAEKFKSKLDDLKSLVDQYFKSK